MPGSLLLGNDAYSDVSDISGRSLDAKIGTKKVSFNKAVRVKQYPWISDDATHTPDHLTLPSNRFWFKVYKNKYDTPSEDDYYAEPIKKNAWTEENDESFHDSLTPIAEVEDCDSEANYSELRNGRNRNNGHFNKPLEPPIDYFDGTLSSPNRSYIGARNVWGGSEPTRNAGRTWNQSSMFDESDENNENQYLTNGNTHKLPRTFLQNNSAVRSSVRKLNNSFDNSNRERRSRSHDENLENSCRFKQFRKADKSVSTEDLNSNSNGYSFSNSTMKKSRDMATQCYGTLIRNNSFRGNGRYSPQKLTQYESNVAEEKNRNLNLLRSNGLYSPQKPTVSSSNIDLERLNNFKVSASRKSFKEDVSSLKARPTISDKKNNEPSKTFQVKCNNVNAKKPPIPIAGRNITNKKFGLQTNAKDSNSVNIVSPRNKNIVARNNDTSNITNKTKTNFSTRFNHRNDFRSTQEDYENKSILEPSTVGYLRGKQIPLSEVNTNTNRRFQTRKDTSSEKDFFRKEQNSLYSSFSPTHVNQSKIFNEKYSSSKPDTKYIKNDLYTTKLSPTHKADPVIDWPLSGFQLFPKPENNMTSISDSEYMVHQRPPLLMYIPGVSHHEKPAIEDDRLSALSDLSRSEMNDRLSSLTTASMRDETDFRRRHSMPRDGKLRFLKWKNKG